MDINNKGKEEELKMAETLGLGRGWLLMPYRNRKLDAVQQKLTQQCKATILQF